MSRSKSTSYRGGVGGVRRDAVPAIRAHSRVGSCSCSCLLSLSPHALPSFHAPPSRPAPRAAPTQLLPLALRACQAPQAGGLAQRGRHGACPIPGQLIYLDPGLCGACIPVCNPSCSLDLHATKLSSGAQPTTNHVRAVYTLSPHLLQHNRSMRTTGAVGAAGLLPRSALLRPPAP